MILDQHGIPYASTGAPFEGASQAPRMSNFIGSSFGPNTAIHMGLRTLRGRSRQAIRNNPLAKGAQKIKTANMVGTGIRPRFNFKNDPGLKSQVQETWEDSVPELDWNGTADFYGQQSIVSDAVFSDGEALAVFRPMSKYDDLAVPLQIQLLEADHLDLDYSTVLPNGNTVRMGIEYDKRGKRVAYHLHRDHPGEHFLNNDTGRQQLLASDVMHVFDPTRPGQQRGLPSSSSVLVKLHEIDLCVDAELVRRKTTAMFGGFIKKMNELAQPAVPQVGGTKRKTSVIPKSPALEPGTFPVLPPGWEVEFSQPRDVSGNYVAWMKQQLMDLAKGWGITYEQLTGDLSGVNYSSIRAGLLEFRRAIEMEQAKTIVFLFCRPVIQRWLDTAVVAGIFNIPNYLEKKRRYYRAITWQPQPWPWVDPYKDMLGELLEARSGWLTHDQALTKRRTDPETHFNQLAEEQALIDSLGIILDSDPRKTSKSGIYQAIEEDKNE